MRRPSNFGFLKSGGVGIGAAPPVFIGFFRKKQLPPLGLAGWQVGGEGGLGEVWPGVTVGRCGRV